MPHHSQPVLSVRQLKKTIKNKPIIKGISFEVGAGEVFGFLGPNGAGKTTTIRMLVGLIRPTEGSIAIDGINLVQKPNEALRHIGCIVENPELYPYMSGWENLAHFARMLPDVDVERIREVVAIVGMDVRIHDKVKTYSLGMRQRLGIAQALLGRPKLLILDEPTNGLDPQGIKEMRDFIRRLAGEGLSVFVSSHLLGEIQLMCDRVAIISHGEVIAVGDVNELLRRVEDAVIWRVEPREPALETLRKAEGLKLLDTKDISAAGAGPGEAASKLATFVTHLDPERIPEVTASLVQAGVRIYGVETKHPTLEELFLQLTEGGRIE